MKLTGTEQRIFAVIDAAGEKGIRKDALKRAVYGHRVISRKLIDVIICSINKKLKASGRFIKYNWKVTDPKPFGYIVKPLEEKATS